MTWAEHAARAARTPCIVVEVDLDWIDDESVTATNPDGSLCYRTPATTVQGDLAVTTRTRRWMTVTAKPLPELGAIPCLRTVAFAAEEVRIGRGLSSFGQATITLTDFVDDDRRAEDPFPDDVSRDTLDLSAATYFSKLVARNPWWSNRPIRVIEGWSTGDVWHPDDTIVHYFLVRDVQGPSDGTFRITAAGPLQLLNLSEAEAPAALGGALLTDITDSATVATFADATIAEDYAASGFMRVGDEVMLFARSGVTLTLDRAELGTLPDQHSAGDELVQCLRYVDTPVTEIIEDLLVTFGKVDPAFLDLAGWAIEQTNWLSLYHLTGTVSQPTKVLDLVQELLEASGSILWWDDTIGKVRLRAVRPALQSVADWSEKTAIVSPPQIKTDIGERVSRTDMLIDLRAADLDPKDSSSYRVRVLGPPEGEAVTEHGSQKLKLIATRWLQVDQIALARRAASLVTSQLRDGRQTIVVEVSAKDAALQIGDVVTVNSRDLIDRTGQRLLTRGLVTKREAIAAGSRYRYTLERIPAGGRFIFLTDAGLPDYDSATADQRDPGWFLGPVGGGPFGPNDPAYVLG